MSSGVWPAWDFRISKTFRNDFGCSCNSQRNLMKVNEKQCSQNALHQTSLMVKEQVSELVRGHICREHKGTHKGF